MPDRSISADRLESGMLLMESPDRSIGVIDRVVHSMGWVHVELRDGGAERFDCAADVLVRDPSTGIQERAS